MRGRMRHRVCHPHSSLSSLSLCYSCFCCYYRCTGIEFGARVERPCRTAARRRQSRQSKHNDTHVTHTLTRFIRSDDGGSGVEETDRVRKLVDYARLQVWRGVRRTWSIHGTRNVIAVVFFYEFVC